MAICDSGCTVALPFPYSNACGVDPLPGGINRIAFLQCDFEFTDITEQSEWDAAIAAGDVVVSGELIGSKPKGTFTKKRVSSCSPERVIGGEKTVVFQDYNRSEVHGDCSKFTFWNTILANPKAFRAVLFTCDGYAYGPIDDFTLEADEVIEETNTGNRYVDGSIMWNQLDMICPEETNLVFDQDSSII